MSLPKVYIPDNYEPSIYALWETSGAFRPSAEGDPYCIVMPPPNANANLHMGHALDMNLKDIIARWQRMRGRSVAYIPGADHAGFETWVVYERQLQAKGQSRFDFSREQLYSDVWQYVEEQRGNMELQLRALGTSCSWDDLVFTLDEKVIDTVYDTFKKMWDDGLIYRGDRIVNYCTEHQTSFADIEVEHETKPAKLWDIAYPTADGAGEVVVSTTRPETMLGDTAVAVHPEDERYKHLVGSKVILPLCDRQIPVVADEYVDKDYGTGVVKVTPAHDPNDFEIGQRHQLEVLNVIGQDGKMVNTSEAYQGLTVDQARQKVLDDLEAGGFRRGEKQIEHAVGKCYKCKSVIQPLVMDQWFIKVKSLADKAIERLEAGEINFFPASKRNEIVAYLSQLRDWNISRQIPWGIPIPAFQNVDDPSDWIFDTRVDQATISKDGKTYQRENDTFDTWFSSGQWPYIVTDYLQGGQLSRFYPTDLMETGMDIMRQWVSRMVMMGVYRTGKVPFKNVYFHGMVNDEKNQKMSKSKGNVVNPMEILAKYGSDALRLGIIASRSAAQSQAFSPPKVVTGRNFCNKLWNIARYTEDLVGDNQPKADPEPKTLADHWVISELMAARDKIDQLISEYRLSEAAETVYHAIWDSVADWYIEASKTEKNIDMLAWVLDTSLKLAHPFAPFVSETIWQALNWHDDLLITSNWPADKPYQAAEASQFEQVKQLISEVRFVCAEMPGNKKYRLLYREDSLIDSNADLIKRLARLESVEHIDEARGLRLATSGREAWLDIDSQTLYEHQSNLEARLVKVRQELSKLEARLSNEKYVAQAPEKLVEETRSQLADKQSLEKRLERELQTVSQ